MKRPSLLFLPFLLFVAGAFVACEEVQEEGKYDNWRQRNEAFIDSIKLKIGERDYVLTAADANNMEVGKLYAIQVPTTSSNVTSQYVYCKKLVKNEVGSRPNFSGYNSIISTYYQGTYITGDQFDRCFDGYSALDQYISLPPEKKTTEFDSPVTFGVNEMIPGWTWPLQFMRVGERWMLYVPWQSGYGSSDYTRKKPDGTIVTIPAYSTLTFDLILDEIVE